MSRVQVRDLPGPVAIQPQARATDPYVTPGMATPGQPSGTNAALRLAEALRDVSPTAERVLGQMHERRIQQAVQEGLLDDQRGENRKGFNQLIADGDISPGYSPWYRIGVWQSRGANAGTAYQATLLQQWMESGIANEDDPAKVAGFFANTRSQFAEQHGADNIYWSSAFAQAAQQAETQLANHHSRHRAKEYERAQVEELGARFLDLVEDGGPVTQTVPALVAIHEELYAAGMPRTQINQVLMQSLMQAYRESDGDTRYLEIANTFETSKGSFLSGTVAFRQARDQMDDLIARDQRRDEALEERRENKLLDELSSGLTEKLASGELSLAELRQNPEWQAMLRTQGGRRALQLASALESMDNLLTDAEEQGLVQSIQFDIISGKFANEGALLDAVSDVNSPDKKIALLQLWRQNDAQQMDVLGDRGFNEEREHLVQQFSSALDQTDALYQETRNPVLTGKLGELRDAQIRLKDQYLLEAMRFRRDHPQHTPEEWTDFLRTTRDKLTTEQIQPLIQGIKTTESIVREESVTIGHLRQGLRPHISTTFQGQDVNEQVLADVGLEIEAEMRAEFRDAALNHDQRGLGSPEKVAEWITRRTQQALQDGVNRYDAKVRAQADRQLPGATLEQQRAQGVETPKMVHTVDQVGNVDLLTGNIERNPLGVRYMTDDQFADWKKEHKLPDELTREGVPTYLNSRQTDILRALYNVQEMNATPGLAAKSRYRYQVMGILRDYHNDPDAEHQALRELAAEAMTPNAWGIMLRDGIYRAARSGWVAPLPFALSHLGGATPEEMEAGEDKAYTAQGKHLWDVYVTLPTIRNAFRDLGYESKPGTRGLEWRPAQQHAAGKGDPLGLVSPEERQLREAGRVYLPGDILALSDDELRKVNYQTVAFMGSPRLEKVAHDLYVKEGRGPYVDIIQRMILDNTEAYPTEMLRTQAVTRLLRAQPLLIKREVERWIEEQDKEKDELP